MNVAEQGIARHLGKERLRYLRSVTVGIAGAGGLGSNCAMHLVRSGFCRFVIADHDRVDASNLNRQGYFLEQVDQYKVVALSRNLRMVNPDLELDIHTVEVTPDNMESIFGQCDVIVEAFDDPACKTALVETFMDSDTFLVSASGIGGFGTTDDVCIRRVRDNFYMVGDMETVCSVEYPPLSPKVGVVAAKQADVVLTYCLENYDREACK